MSAIESRASELHQRVPDARRLAFLLVFKPRELWARMVLWDLDGDPGLAFIWPLRERHQRAWVSGLAEILGAAYIFAYLVLVSDHGWSELLELATIGLLVTVIVACVAGIAFATLLGILVAVTMMAGVWLPPEISGVAMAALWCFGIGFSMWISWVISERVFDDNEGEVLRSGHHSHLAFQLFVLVGGAFACYRSGETGLQRIALAGLLGLGISLHPLVEWIRRKAQRRRRPLAFLSYRRQDTASQGLVKELHRKLPDTTFLDERMPSGEWQPGILSALERATVLLAFVGPQEQEEEEIEEGDPVQKRLSFWVWLEQGYAWRRNIPIRAILVDRDVPPSRLSDFQYISVRSRSKEKALKSLIDTLKRDGFPG